MVSLLNTPAVKFVERRGTTIEDDLGRTNPWSLDWFCPRKECEPCRGRLFLAKEVEEEALMAVAATVSEEGTGEGINYTIECVTCRKEGVKRRYYGE